MEQQYKGFAYANESKPTVLYGNSAEDILSRLKSYNVARVADMKFKTCNIGSLDVESGKYTNYHKYDVATGKDISNTYLEIPSLRKEEFKKVITELKEAGAQYNPYAKRWYVTADQDVQKFEDICNQFQNLEETPNKEPASEAVSEPNPETTDAMPTAKNIPQVEGVEIQYAVKMDNQQTVMISATELGVNPTDVTVGELIDKLGEKAAERIQNDPEMAVKESEYSISVSKNAYDNRCTVYYNDGRDPVHLMGDRFGVHFPTMEANAVAEFVTDYMRKQESPDLGVQKAYQVGEQIDCYIPIKSNVDTNSLDKIQNPYQPIYVEGIEHVVGTVQHLEQYGADSVFSEAHMEYQVRLEDGTERFFDSSEIYAPSQAQVLLRATEDELTAQQFDLIADRRLSSAQMEEIRFGFKDGLSAEQVALYAHPDMKPAEMDLCRIGLQKGLGYAEISDLLKETKELSWTDSRNRLNEAIRGQEQAERAPEIPKEVSLEFYGQKVELGYQGRKLITQEMVDHLLNQDIEKPDFSNCHIVGVDFNQGAYNKVLSEASFENSILRNCQFNDMELQTVNFKNASVNDSEFKHALLKNCDFENASIAHVRFRETDILGNHFKEASIRHGYFRDCAIEENDFTRALIDGTEVWKDCDITADQKGLETIQYTMGGAREDEFAAYRDRTSWRLSGAEVSYERKEALQEYFRNESSELESKEWRDELTVAEEKLVAEWDKQATNAEMQLSKDILAAAAQAEVRMGICEDIMKSGFKPTKSLISNMEKLNAITGEQHKLKDVVKLYRENDFKNNQELSKTVLDIAEECKQQEISRVAESIVPE